MSTEKNTLTLEVISSEITKFEANRVDEIIAAAKAHAESIVADPKTAKGRELLKSEAYKISQTKTQIVKLANASIEDAKAIVNGVTKERVRLEKAFDEIRDQIKAPAVEWEKAEEARKAKIKDRATQIRNLDGGLNIPSAEIKARIAKAQELYEDFDWQDFAAAAKEMFGEILNTLNAALASRVQYEAEQAELKRLREEKAKRDAEEAERIAEEKRKAYEKAEEDRKKAAFLEINRKAIATLREWADGKDGSIERLKGRLLDLETFVCTEERFGDLYGEAVAVRDLAKAKIQSQIDVLNAKAAQEAKDRAEREAKEAVEREAKRIEEAKAKAIEDERKRIADEQLLAEQKRQAEELAEAKRRANEEHRRKVREEAIAAIVACIDAECDAEDIVRAIELGEIPHVSITF